MPEIKQNTTMAVIAYILFFIPLLTGDAKKDEFVKFHTKQGLVLFIISIIVNTIQMFMPYSLYWSFGWIFNLVNLAIFILFIIGISNALKGKKEQLPVIGKLADNFKF